MYLDEEYKIKQHEKICYIANKTIKRLLSEDCTDSEYKEILKTIEERILGCKVFEICTLDEDD